MEENEKKAGGSSWTERINYNTYVAIVLIAFSVTAFVLIPYQIEKPKLFMGRSLSTLTPSLFPRISIVALFFLSVFYLIHSTEFTERNLFKELSAKSLIRVIVTIVVFLGYAFVFEPLGFVLSSALMAGALTLYYGNRNVFVLLGVVIGAPLTIYFIFTHVLQVSLPEGLLF